MIELTLHKSINPHPQRSQLEDQTNQKRLYMAVVTNQFPLVNLPKATQTQFQQQQSQDTEMVDKNLTKSDLSETSLNRTVHTMMTTTTVLTKTLDDLWDDLSDKEEARIKRELRVDKAQIKRDKVAEENRWADRAATEDREEDLIAALEQDQLTKKNVETAQLRTDLVLTAHWRRKNNRVNCRQNRTDDRRKR